MTNRHFDIVVAGGGLAGASAALAAAEKGWQVALVAPPPANQDGRTTALLAESLALLDRLGIWESVRPHSAPLKVMRIIDGTSRLVRSPPVSFHANEIDLDAFGWNIPNGPLLETLHTAVTANERITVLETAVVDAVEETDAADLTLENGARISASCVLAADGRKSRLREAAGIAVHTWSYPQTALVMNFTHTVPHDFISTEFHTERGPFTVVPLPGKRSSLVWAVRPDEVDAILALSQAELDRAVETRMQSLLGAVTVENRPQAWPLSSLIARAFGKGRIMLIGESGHAFPPIGAQGLNLGLRDIMAAIDSLEKAGGPQGALDAVRAFDRARRLDVGTRTAGVDLLNRALLSSFLPVQMVRAGGLSALARIGPLRRLVMREGMTPGWRTRRRAS